MLNPDIDREAVLCQHIAPARTASLLSCQEDQPKTNCRLTSGSRVDSAQGRLVVPPCLRTTQKFDPIMPCLLSLPSRGPSTIGSVVFPGPADLTNHDSSKELTYRKPPDP